MKKIYLLTLLVLSAAFASAQVLDQFNYTGSLVTNGWATQSGTAGELLVVSTASDNGNSLSYAGLPASVGNRMVIASTGSEDVNKPVTGISGTGYYSMLVKVLNTTGLSGGAYFAGFSATTGAGASVFAGRLYIKNGSAAGKFQLGIQASNATAVFYATELNINQTYFVVVKQTAGTSGALFVNPVPGSTEPSTPQAASTGTGTFNAFAGLFIRQATGTGNVEIDEIRTGSTWASVTPSGCATVNNMGAVSSCGTYTLNGTQYTTSGTYTQTLVNGNQAGCDSTINFTLTVKQPTVNNMTVSACNSYTLNGTTYTTSGNYQQVLQNANAVGCDSTINLALTISTSITYYEDLDLDGLGNPNVTQPGCAPISGYVTNGNDCNDNNASIGAATVTYYQDLDNDTYGNPAMSQTACTQPPGYVANNLDCNDNNSAVTVAQNWYPDTDGDTYGSSTATPVVACTAPANHVPNNMDCNDNNNAIHPGATEIPDNGIDEDCNGSDLNTIGAQLAQYTFTGNTCAAPMLSVTAQPANAVFSDYMATADNLVCESGADVTNYSGWNTTATVDTAEYYAFMVTPAECYKLELTKLTFTHRTSGTGGTPTIHIRSSLDGYAADAASVQLTQAGTAVTENVLLPAAFASVTGPVTFRFHVTNMGQEGSTYRHDNVSLTGFITPLPTQTFYADTDEDGFGNPAVTTTACTAPAGYVADNTDCDDTDAAEFPGAVWYLDSDNDTYGNPAASQVSCTRPAGYVSNNTDCDDNNAAVTGQIAYYVDADQDGYGENGSEPQMDCAAPAGFVANDDDCDDDDSSVNPEATEICDGIDNNCDGNIDENLTISTWYEDADEDGFGNAAMSVSDCTQPEGYVANDDDCDDDNAAVYPGATEVAGNAIDENCDGVDGYLSVDENVFGTVSVFPNPGTSAVTIRLTATVSGAVAQLISADGKLISTTQVSGTETVIDTENVLPGIYFVKISNAASATTIRWIRK